MPRILPRIRRRAARPAAAIQEEMPVPANVTTEERPMPPFSIKIVYGATITPLGNLTITLEGIGDLTQHCPFGYTTENGNSTLTLTQVGADQAMVQLFDYTSDRANPLILMLLSCFADADQKVIIDALRSLAVERQDWHETQMKPASDDAIIYPLTHQRELNLSAELDMVRLNFSALFRHLKRISAPVRTVEG